ncbi:UDP-3-O-(3-hydroxymyristoyl)glucosamine N-acyltransferase [Acinetobacter sp. YH12075]|uniref:UDP-3-O-(3-hydroxymyristoyl)glucosamine N-acyltransferase n=1 Tax=Acinetobacter sp. YH12075 TaxID=2601070 RepID=UPI0015D20082|nr:UDP-3-O-(3-hydroxymyristoyl)glucosamine N-acyltransferase [Acinetobacter sp. YH12075]
MGYKLKAEVSLKEVFEKIGIVWQSEKDYSIDAISPLNNYVAGSLSFCNKNMEVPHNAILISNQNFDNAEVIFSESPRTHFVQVLAWLHENVGFDLYNENSIIDSTAIIGANVVIESGCRIGANVVIEPNVVIHKGTIIGNNSRVRSCSSIGSDGFGFERIGDDIVRFPHLGRVKIGQNVEVGACVAIARGTLSDTVIHDQVKIDNLVHIAHNVIIHDGAFVIACAEVSGSVEIGKNAWIAPNACINQKLKIGDGALVGLGAVVTKHVESDSIVAGNPAKKLVKR